MFVFLSWALVGFFFLIEKLHLANCAYHSRFFWGKGGASLGLLPLVVVGMSLLPWIF